MGFSCVYGSINYQAQSMELGLRLGDDSTPFGFAEKPREPTASPKGLDFCLGFSSIGQVEEEDEGTQNQIRKEVDENDNVGRPCVAMDDVDVDSPLQLDLLPRTPVVPRSSHPSRHNLSLPSSETGISEVAGFSARSTDMISGRPASAMAADGGGGSPRNAVLSSSFEREFCKYDGGGNGRRVGCLFQPENAGSGMEFDDGGERGCSRASDEDDQNIGSASRKKLRLSREQSAFLEDSFKEHHILYPKQKLELAKRLNLRPRQVEVWFQNRRARTKLKQTEVDCEYLKKCCETLTQENRKLQKELQDLRALKTTDSIYMHLPATTLTMCPSCERVATATTTAAAVAAMQSSKEPTSKESGFSFTRPGSYPFAHTSQPTTRD